MQYISTVFTVKVQYINTVISHYINALLVYRNVLLTMSSDNY